MADPAYFGDHAEKTRAAIRPHHRSEPMTQLLDAFAEEIQQIEDDLDALNSASIDNATGATLDAWGELVGQRRQGMADGQYRAFIRARIATNRSKGTAEELIQVIALITAADPGSVRVFNAPPAGVQVSYVVRFPTPVALQPVLRAQLLETLPSGVRLDTITEGVDLPFAFLGYEGPSGGFSTGTLAGSF